MTVRIPGVTDTTLDPKVYGPNEAMATSIKNKYSVDNLSYPEDLFAAGDANRYGNNYVIFYINVNDDSRLLSKNNPLAIVDEIPARMRGSLIGQQFEVETFGSAIAGIASLGLILSGGFAGSVISRGAKIAAGAAAGYYADEIGNASGGLADWANEYIPFELQRQQKRLTKAIALHVPNQLNIRYSTQWQDTDTFLAHAVGILGSDIGKVAESISKGEGTQAWDHVKDGGGTVASIVGNIALSQRIPPLRQGAEAAQIMTGIAPNPKKEQMFKNVNFREFSFEYTFSPRSSSEAQSVLRIIHEFKLHMHPEYKDDGGFLFIYPSEFDIAYYHNGVENPALHKHTSCILKDMQINYTPNGNFNTFEGGMPTQINVVLSFLEIAFLTKENIEEGY